MKRHVIISSALLLVFGFVFALFLANLNSGKAYAKMAAPCGGLSNMYCPPYGVITYCWDFYAGNDFPCLPCGPGC